MKLKIIKQNKKTTLLEIRTEDLENFLEMINNKKIEKPKPKRCRKNITLFNRKVVPFFMNQFKKHLDNGSESSKEILQYLVNLKLNKKSKQKKYELGDLVNIFKDPQLRMVKDSWLDFLEFHAEEAANVHPKLSDKSREQYISEIVPLLDQQNKKEPYKLYLSREQRVNNYEIQENQSFDQECSTQYTINIQSNFSNDCNQNFDDYFS